MPAGRPTKYKEIFATQARVACEELGATDISLAKLFGVSKTTITTWKKEQPEFLASIKAGRDVYDTARVEDSLLRRANGYFATETTKEQTFVEGQPTGMQVTKTVKKKVAPDVTAAIFWLKNRNPERWRDVKSTELTGKDGQPVQIEDKAAAALMGQIMASTKDSRAAPKEPDDADSTE